ncbi:hypothetical protein E4U43_001552 [Claviceps pusilla]|uniref:Uncharacterized protein n=1 Tax=Claviceps pusilla TaxID=123648 RepID=A0A9P7SZ61_9HYPO|nr:hypothetical protein E4U43_001552 [Claviceps pusilla]
MRPDSEKQSSQWSDMTGALASQRHGSRRKKQVTPLQDPFSDPIYEDRVIQLRSFEALNASRSEPCPEDFVLEHPSRKSCQGRRSQTDCYLKSAFHDDGEKEDQVEDEADAEEGQEEKEEKVTDFGMGADTLSSSIVISPAVEMHSNPRLHGQNPSLAASSSQQRRNTHVPSSSYNVAGPLAAKLVTVLRVEPGCVRTSSIYEDDVDSRHSFAAYNGNNRNSNNNNSCGYGHGHGHDSYHYNDYANSERRTGAATKRRPATVGFESTVTSGELMPSNSKSSSHASADPFRFDGDRYSPFLKSSAERDISKALYREDSNLTVTPGSNATAAAKVDDAVKVPVLKHAALKTASDEHPLSQPQLDDDLINSSLSASGGERQHDAEEDWQTVTTEQTRRPRALELTLRLDRDVGSSLADISVSGVSGVEFDDFVGGANTEIQFRSARNVPPPRPPSQHGRAFGHDPNASRPSDPFFRQSYQKHHRRPARAAAAIRHLSHRLSPDHLRTRTRTCLRNPIPSYASLDSDLDREFQTGPHRPRTTTITRDDGYGGGDVDDDNHDDGHSHDDEEDQDSPPFRSNNWPVSALRLDSQEILGNGIRHDNHSTAYHSPRPFAAAAPQPPAPPSSSSHHHHHHHRSSLTTITTLPRFPFPLISLPEAAALQSQRRERGQEDHSDPGPAFAAKARSCTISTISTNSPNTPASPARGSSSCWLAKPKQAYRPHDRGHTLQHHPSSELLDPDPHASFFRTSVPNSTSLLSARFFRLSNFSARSRTRGAHQRRPALAPSAQQQQQQRYFHHDSFFTPSQTDLIRSAREDILFRRRHHTEDDEPQRRIFLLILVLTIVFPLIGLLALWGRFDGTIAWYARGERGGMTPEQRATLKQQLLVEAFLYPSLIIALSVYYSVHN